MSQRWVTKVCACAMGEPSEAISASSFYIRECALALIYPYYKPALKWPPNGVLNIRSSISLKRRARVPTDEV